jgi:hypothetical protein
MPLSASQINGQLLIERRWVPHQMHGTSRQFGGEAQWDAGQELNKQWPGKPAGEEFNGLAVCHLIGKNTNYTIQLAASHRICWHVLHSI